MTNKNTIISNINIFFKKLLQQKLQNESDKSL